MFKFSVSSNHCALDQRSRDSKIRRRCCDIASDYRAETFPRLRDARCKDCVGIEKDSHECALPKESKCRRATYWGRRPILTRKEGCLHDLRKFAGHRSSISCACSIRSDQYTLTEWRRSIFRYKMGPNSIRNKSDTSRECPGWFVRNEVAWLRSNNFLTGKCTDSSCDLWHLPVCQNYRSESGCTFGEQCQFRHTEAAGQPIEKSKKSGEKGSVAFLKESIQLGCVSQDYPLKKIYSAGSWKIGIESHSQILPMAPHKKFWRERVHREELWKSVNL